MNYTLSCASVLVHRRVRARAGLALSVLLGVYCAPLAAMEIKPGGGPEEQVFGGWGLLCFDRKPKVCTLSQSVAADARGTQVVMGVSVRYPPGSNKPEISFHISRDAMADAGIGLKIDQGAEYRLPMGQCDDRACAANGWLVGDLKAALEDGQVAQVAFFMPGKKQVLAPITLKGFKSGVSALTRAVAERR